jgi:predicted CoA-binding protein
MKTQKVIITKSETVINLLLKDGYSVVSVTPQYVATGGTSHLYGEFLILLEKDE